ncbi:LANO_0C07888g1_1 [Lachancea nothofagi CBS 11611]|uniref:Cysteine protease n=1 Tax=Lachancea nothofagi CBS 11611 TaxID=1266666 RepID=A0A1G4J8W2_9SACH|nr:LANO_0C07888g1_1 [Lachancea nothofagi CBS 11611]
MEFLQRVSQQLFELENTDTVHDLVILGKTYAAMEKDGSESEAGLTTSASPGVFGQLFNRDKGWNPEFLERVQELVHFTYRTKFEPIPKDPAGPSPMNFGMLFRENPLNSIESAINHPDCFCSDIGWGCMIRTGQALLGNALQQLQKLHTKGDSLSHQQTQQVIGWFEDRYSAPFSLHNFVKQGLKLSHKSPGEWFGPSATSRSIQSLVLDFPECGISQCVISTDSADVYEEDLEPIFAKDPDSVVLLLLGVKLGLDNVNARYWNDVRQILNSHQSVGIAGGRPSSSLYFFGYQDEYLFYLDPHTSQLDLASLSSSQEKYNSVHSHRFNKIHFSELDPSMLIGVLLRGSEGWKTWKQDVADSQIIHVLPSRPQDYFLDDDGVISELEDETDQVGARDSTLDGEYVDVAPMCQQAGLSNNDDEFQDVQCKNQKILIFGDHDSTAPDTEVERVLVGQETVPLVISQEPKTAITPVL